MIGVSETQLYVSRHVSCFPDVPVTAVFAFDLDLSQVDTSRCTARVQSGRVEKWQLSSEDHSRILCFLSETLDDHVAAAVQNVSGRS